MKATFASLAIIRGTRALFGTFMDDGSFMALATRTVLPVLADDVFTSRGNVTNAAVRRGSALLTGSTMSVAALSLSATRFYEGPRAAILNCAVGDSIDEATKVALADKVEAFYGIDS